jgi:hypothetical protein
MHQDAMSRPHSVPIGPQAELLMRRLEDLERLMAVQEWWMLGRALPEALALAEVTSLVTVARAELDRFLAQYCGIATAAAASSSDDGGTLPQTDSLEAQAEWRASAAHVLRVLAAALPPTTTFARALRPAAERNALPPAAQDLLGIVSDRLSEAQETLQGLRL